MSVNLLNLLKDQMTGGVVDQISGLLGEDKSKSSSAINNALPTILGGLAKQASTESGANRLASMLDRDHDGSMLDDLPGLLKGDMSKGPFSKGAGLIDGIFGDKLGSIVSLVSRVSGVGSGSSRSLLGMLAPMVMGLLGKQKRSRGLDAAGIASMLLGQGRHLKSALPAGASGLLGLGSLLDGPSGSVKAVADKTVDSGRRVVDKGVDGTKRVADKTYNTGKKAAGNTYDAGKKTAEAGGGLLKKLLPLGLLLLLGLFAIPYLMKGCNKASNVVEKTAKTTGDLAGKAAKTTGNAVKGATNAAGNVAGKAVDATGNAVKGAGNAVKGAANATGNAVKGAANATGNAVKGAANATGNAVKGAGNAVKNAAAATASALGLKAGSAEAKFADGLSKRGVINKTYILDGVQYDTGSANLKASSYGQLNSVVKVLKSYPKVTLELGGHTDARGDAGKNQTLSQQRAESVKKYLVQKGIPANRLSTKGYGSKQPLDKGTTAAAYAKNRRTEVKVTKE